MYERQNLALSNFLTNSHNLALLQLLNDNLSYIFPFLKASSLSLQQINLCGTKLWHFKQNFPGIVSFKVLQYGYETFQTVKPELQRSQIHLALNLSQSL